MWKRPRKIPVGFKPSLGKFMVALLAITFPTVFLSSMPSFRSASLFASSPGIAHPVDVTTRPLSKAGKKMSGSDRYCTRHWQLVYSQYHSASIKSQPTSNLLVWRPVMGWGNQVWSLSFVLSLAVLTNKILLLDMGYHASGDSIQHVLLPKSINWTIGWSIPDVVEVDYTNYTLSQLQSERVILHFNQRMIHFLDAERYPERTHLKLGMDDHKTLLLPLPCVYHFLFQRSNELDDLISTYLKELTHVGPYIAMHIRTGKGEKGGTHFVDSGNFTLPAFLDSAAKIEEQNGLPPATKWLLATNDLELGLEAQALLPEKVVLTNTKLTPTTGLHPTRFKGVDKKLDTATMHAGILAYMLDWFLLGESDFLICTSSSFATTASLVAQKRCSNLPSTVKTTSGFEKLQVCT